MKKPVSVALLFVLILILPLFTGCRSESEPLLICVDLEHSMVDIADENILADGTFDSELKRSLIQRMLEAGNSKGIDVPKDFEIEYIPKRGTERKIALERIRTEIMSGEGPDIFLIACNAKTTDAEDALFAIPEKAMQLSIFLTLDDYMENKTVFAEWERMHPAVLAAGRTNEGQQIIPLTYTLPASIYKKGDATHTPSKETTWMDMLESEDEALAASAVWTDNLYSELAQGAPFMSTRIPMTEFILGPIADYAEEELLFTEEELKQRLDEIIDLGARYTNGEFNSAPAHYTIFLGQEFDGRRLFFRDADGTPLDSTNGIKNKDGYTMIPLYSDDGGVTAEIMTYMAINRNTKRPDDAFRVLDHLVSYSEQKSGRFYIDIYGYCGERTNNHLLMYNDLMTETQRIAPWSMASDTATSGWYLSDENHAALSSVRDQITHVRFRSTLDIEFINLYQAYLNAVGNMEEQNKIVSEAYRRMQQILRE